MTEESPGCFNIEVIKKKTSQLIFLFLVIILSFACLIKKSLSDIKESGEITLLTKNNAHCYYSYRESPMGFEYELSMAFADYLGVDLRVITPGWPRMYAALNKGRGDFIAASLTITPEREKIVDFSDEYMSIQQQVIIHKDNPEIKQLDDLKEKTVHISKGSSYHERLLDLNEEGFEIKLVAHKRTSTEEFIRQIAEKEIDITVADSNIAILNRLYYPDIKMAFPLNKKQSLGWVVREDQSELLNEINKFFQKIKNFLNGRQLYINDLPNNTKEYIYIDKSNAARCFSNFFTTSKKLSINVQYL